MENLENICISYIEPILTISIDKGLVQAINKLNKISQIMDLPYPQIIASTEYEIDKSRIMFTGHKDWIHSLAKKLSLNEFQVHETVQHGLFVSALGLMSSNFEALLFERLESSNFKISKTIRDAKGLLLIFPESDKSKFVEFGKSLLNP